MDLTGDNLMGDAAGDGDGLISSASMCLFFLIKFLHGSERVLTSIIVTFGSNKINKFPCFCRFLISSLKLQIRLFAVSLQDGYLGPDFF